MARTRSTRNKIVRRRVRTDISRNKRTIGKKSTKISGAVPSKSVIQKETSTTMGWDRTGPVLIREKKTIERFDNNNESSDNKQ